MTSFKKEEKSLHFFTFDSRMKMHAISSVGKHELCAIISERKLSNILIFSTHFIK